MHRRMIDPSFWQSETIAELDIETRYLFIGLFSNADDQGRLRAHPALLRSLLFKFDDVGLDYIERRLTCLEKSGLDPFIQTYEVDNRKYIQILNWWRWQHPRWAYPSDWPAPQGWEDRLRYRKGNKVVKANWDEPKPEPDLEAIDQENEPEPSQSEPMVNPDPSQGETDVGSAHRVRVSNRVSNRVRGRVSNRDSNSSIGPDPPETPAVAGDDRIVMDVLTDKLLDLGIRREKARSLAHLYLFRGESEVLADWADRWIWHYSKDTAIRNPHGMAITALEEFQEPTFFRDDDRRRYLAGDYEDYIES